MKIIHTADLHLGSKIEGDLSSISNERKNEILDTFRRIVEYAKKNDVRIILLSGDVFDTNKPAKKDMNYFFDTIRDSENIDFIYLRGNHDINIEIPSYPNLKTFNKDSFTYYQYGNITIAGREYETGNEESLYTGLELKEDNFNILMLHVDMNNSNGNNLLKAIPFKHKYIDFIALGHIHKGYDNVLDDRGRICMCGTPEGRSFDECGEKHFVLLDINGNKMTKTEIQSSFRTNYDLEVDISSCNSTNDIIKTIEERLNPKDIYRITLTGEVKNSSIISLSFIKNALKDKCHFLILDDKTRLYIDPKDYENEISLRGEFIRNVMNDESLSNEDKEEILKLGIKALKGEEL